VVSNRFLWERALAAGEKRELGQAVLPHNFSRAPPKEILWGKVFSDEKRYGLKRGGQFKWRRALDVRDPSSKTQIP